MDVRYINPFIGAIKNVFNTMLGTEILISKPRLKEQDEGQADVSAAIGFSGQALGFVTMRFPLKTGINAASKFSDAEISQNDPEFADALGELANMVAGHAKAQLEGFDINISLPRVFSKHDAENQPLNAPSLIIPCDSALGRFNTEITMVLQAKPNRNPA